MGANLLPEPTSRHGPVSFYFCRSNLERCGDLLHGSSSEKAHLHNSGLLRVQLGQLVERVIQCQQFRFAVNLRVFGSKRKEHRTEILVKWNAKGRSSSLGSLMPSRVVH